MTVTSQFPEALSLYYLLITVAVWSFLVAFFSKLSLKNDSTSEALVEPLVMIHLGFLNYFKITSTWVDWKCFENI